MIFRFTSLNRQFTESINPVPTFLAEFSVLSDQGIGHQQVMAEKTSNRFRGRQAAHGAGIGLRDRQSCRNRYDIENLQNFRRQRHQVKIVNGRKARKMRLQNPSLLPDVLKRFVFEFNHQVHPSAEGLHHLFEGGNQGQARFRTR